LNKHSLLSKQPSNNQNSIKEVDDILFETFCEGLKKHTSTLQELHLNLNLNYQKELGINNFTCKSFASLAEFISTCTQLKHLYLNLSE